MKLPVLVVSLVILVNGQKLVDVETRLPNILELSAAIYSDERSIYLIGGRIFRESNTTFEGGWHYVARRNE